MSPKELNTWTQYFSSCGRNLTKSVSFMFIIIAPCSPCGGLESSGLQEDNVSKTFFSLENTDLIMQIIPLEINKRTLMDVTKFHKQTDANSIGRVHTLMCEMRGRRREQSCSLLNCKTLFT